MTGNFDTLKAKVGYVIEANDDNRICGSNGMDALFQSSRNVRD
jgi:hypothetical protein